MSVFLGIDTSNYTTSAAVCVDGVITENRKIPVSVKEGERGIRQSDAVFSHIKNLPEVISALGELHPDAVGVSSRPRDVEGSYMPCFMAGLAFAKSYASLCKIPCYEFSHQAGHVRAAIYSGNSPELLSGEFYAFHVSGGTSEMLLYSDKKLTKIGGTVDLNAGQLIDRTGVMLGIRFPCGPELEKICDFGTKIKPLVCVKDTGFNLSGLENKALEMNSKGVSPSEIAAFIIMSIEKTLEKTIENAFKLYGKKQLLFSGGVMSNKYINKCLSEKYGAVFASPAFSSDNAAGTALLCSQTYKENFK